jgi:hypothetical protein
MARRQGAGGRFHPLHLQRSVGAERDHHAAPGRAGAARRRALGRQPARRPRLQSPARRSRQRRHGIGVGRAIDRRLPKRARAAP